MKKILTLTGLATVAVVIVVTTFQTLRPAFLPKAALAQAIITNNSQVIDIPSTASVQFTNGGSCWEDMGNYWRSIACENNTVIPYSYVQGLGFSIPSDAKITGVGFSFYSLQQGTCDSGDATPGTYIVNVGISYQGNVIGTPDNADQLVSTGGENVACDSNTLYTFGGPGDTWGATLTPAIVNDPSFGYAFQYQLGGGRAFVELDQGTTGVASVTVYYTTSLDAEETATNIPTSFNEGEQETTGTDGNPISITMQNTGSIPWDSQFTSTDTGTPQGTCGYDYGSTGVGDAPPSGSASGATCTVPATLTSLNYFLVHTASDFSVSPESVPITYTGVTKTTTYTAAHTVTVEVPCGALQKDKWNILSFIEPAFAMVAPPEGGTCPEETDVPQSWSVSYSGGGYTPSIAPGQSVVFPISSITAPSTAGTYTETWQMEDESGNLFGSQVPVSIAVANTTPVDGTVTVMSENSVLPSVGVGAQWDIVDGVNDVCSTSGIPCQGTTETYPNQPAVGDAGVADAGSLTVPPSSISLLNGSSPYALKSIQLAPIAQKQGGLINTMLSLTKSVFGSTAEAFTIPPANPLAQTLSPGSTAAFVILWNPIANIAVSPAAMPLTAAAGGTASGQVQVSNTGAPGSTLTWSSSIAYTNGSGWLSVSPASDATGLTNGASGNASENATITANAAGLAVGTYTGTVTFTGDSTVWPSPGPLVNTVTVTFTVTGIGGSGYDCANNACSSVGSGAQYGSVASCDAACGFSGSVSGMTVSCNPSSIYTNGTSTCTATVDGSGGYSSGVIWSATAGTIDQSGNYTGPGTTGTVTVTATSEQDPTQSGQTEITVNTAPPPTCNGANCQAVCSSPTLTASPSSIVVPESSSLTYGCSNVTQCTLTGGGLDETQTLPTPGTITGSATTTPSMTTTYTLTCVNGDYSSDSTNASVQVVVGGSSLCEQNPNGAGCSGQ